METTWKVTIQKWEDSTEMDFNLLLLSKIYHFVCPMLSLSLACPGAIYLKDLPFLRIAIRFKE
jgi:hypothetical protein